MFSASCIYICQVLCPRPSVCAQVMRWMEQCSYIAASRVGRSGHLLTGSMDSLAFAQPTRVADIMYITAQVRIYAFIVRDRCGRVRPGCFCLCSLWDASWQPPVANFFLRHFDSSIDCCAYIQLRLFSAQVTGIFGSSMEVMVSVCGETPAEGASVFHCGDAYATVVAVDPEGQPAEVPFELAPASPDDIRRCAGVAARCAALLCRSLRSLLLYVVVRKHGAVLPTHVTPGSVLDMAHYDSHLLRQGLARRICGAWWCMKLHPLQAQGATSPAPYVMVECC